MLELGRPQPPEEDLAHQLAEEDDKDEGLHVDDGHAGIGLSDVHHGGVELLALEVGVGHHGRRQHHG